MALSGFDKDYYLAAKLAALQATETEWVGKDVTFLELVLTAHGLTAESHYTAYGYAEGLQPNAYFNEAQYKLAKATAMFDAGTGGYLSVEDAQADFEAKWPWDAYHHYLAYGSAEGVNPSNDFDESSYLASKLAALQTDADPDTAAEWADKTVDDVQAAFTANGLSCLGHYIAYGEGEEIAVTPVPTDEQVDVDVPVVGETFILTTGLDNVVGTANDDTIIGLVDGSDDTLTLGDSIDGGSGTDTLDLITDKGIIDLGIASFTSVENAEINDATGSITELDVDNIAFESLSIEGMGSDNADIINVDASTMVTITGADDADNTDVEFSASGASTLHMAVTDSVDGDIEFIYDELTATTLDITLDASNLDNQDVDVYADDTGDNADITSINTTVNASNLTDSYLYMETYNASEGIERAVTVNMAEIDNSYIELEDYHGTGSNNTLNVNISNSDGAEFEFYTYDDVDGTLSSGTTDTLNLTLDSVTSEDNDSWIYVEDMEIINVTVTGDSHLDYIGTYSSGDGDYAEVQTYTIAANADLTVDTWDVTDDGIANFTISGAGNVDIETLGDNEGETWNASAATGNITLETGYDSGDVDYAGVTVTTGTGADSITVDTEKTAVSTGAGDDFVDTNGYDFGLATAEALDGGADTDTIVIDDGLRLDAATAANISNFEILDFTSGTGTYDMDVETSLKDVLASTSIDAPVGIVNVAGDVALTLNKFNDPDDITLVLKDGTGTSDALALNLNAIDADTDQNPEDETDAVIVAADYETINLTSNATTASEESAPGADDALTAADYTNTVDLDAADMTDLVISGNAMAAVTFTDATALTFVDASASEAGVDVNVFDALTLPSAGVTFKGSDAADTYYSANGGDTIQAGGGADTLVLNDGTTLSGGDDTIRYTSVTDSQLTLIDTDDPADGEADVMEGFDVIENFGAEGTDLIELSSLLGLATGDARADMLQLGAIGGATAAAMETFIGDGVDFFDTSVVDRATAFADDGIDGYLFIDANSDGDFTQADDMVINLAGVTSLAITDISFG